MRDAERVEMPPVAGEQQEIAGSRGRGDQHIREAGVYPLGRRGVGHSSRRAANFRIHMNKSVVEGFEQPIEPRRQPFGPLDPASAPQLANSLFDLGDRYRGEMKFAVPRAQPSLHLRGRTRPIRREIGEHGCVEQTRPHKSTSRIGRSSRSNSAPPGKLSRKSTKDGRFRGIDFARVGDRGDHRDGNAMPRDRRRTPLRGRLDQSGKARLRVSRLHGFHALFAM